MKSKLTWLLTMLALAGMVISACGGAATPEAPTQAPVEAPTSTAGMEEESEPTAPAEISESELDAAYDVFLADMVKYNTIDLATLNEMLSEEPPPFVLDVRSEGEVEEKGYIQGATVIPLRELGQHLDLLPSFDTTIVSYCGSGWRCTIAMTALEALGWQDVLSLKGGSFGGWVEAGYPVAEGVPEPVVLDAASPDAAMAAHISEVLAGIPEGWGVITADVLNEELMSEDVILLDVRRNEEMEEKGIIEGSTPIPLEEFIDSKTDWPADQDAKIVVYCGSGHRSTIAMTILWSYGYTDVRSLKGGFSGWAGSGYPIVGGQVALDPAFNAFLADMVKYNTIDLASLNEMLAEEPPPFLLDVRSLQEVEEKGYIEGAVVIPLRELAQHLDQLPSFDTTIVSYCGSGWRCTIAMTALEALGWKDVLSLKGGSFGGWVEAGYPIAQGVPETVVLNAASPDAALVAHMDEVLSSIPEGWGVATADQLNVELMEGDVTLVDVRRTEELQEKGLIEGALHIPLEEFVDRKADWPADQDATIVVYCGSGHRSTIAMTMMWAYGYSDVRSLKGGFNGWVEAGYPTVEFAAVQ